MVKRIIFYILLGTLLGGSFLGGQYIGENKPIEYPIHVLELKNCTGDSEWFIVWKGTRLQILHKSFAEKRGILPALKHTKKSKVLRPDRQTCKNRSY